MMIAAQADPFASDPVLTYASRTNVAYQDVLSSKDAEISWLQSQLEATLQRRAAATSSDICAEATLQRAILRRVERTLRVVVYVQFRFRRRLALARQANRLYAVQERRIAALAQHSILFTDDQRALATASYKSCGLDTVAWATLKASTLDSISDNIGEAEGHRRAELVAFSWSA